MADLVVFTEEPSASIVIQTLANRFAPQRSVLVVAHEGKSDLRASFPRKMGGWRHPPDVEFLVLMDKDGHPECMTVKNELLALVPSNCSHRSKVRILMPCLEAWYLSDPEALKESGVVDGGTAERIARDAKFRNPEDLHEAKQEFLRLIGLRGQIKLARTISPYLDPERARASSLRNVVQALRGV